jgi:hypothetical protein
MANSNPSPRLAPVIKVVGILHSPLLGPVGGDAAFLGSVVKAPVNLN